MTHHKFDGEFAGKIDFTHAQFVYLHFKIKMRMHKSPDTSKFAGNLSLVNPLICAQSLADNFTDGITTGKNDNPTFFWLSDSEKLKKYLLGW